MNRRYEYTSLITLKNMLVGLEEKKKKIIEQEEQIYEELELRLNIDARPKTKRKGKE